MTWLGMMHRCYDEKARGWANYGGRGIAVSPAWHDVAGFIAAVEREIGPRPPGCTLDRIDNDGDYCPGNIRWATNSQQQLNARSRLLQHKGSWMPMAKLTEQVVAECRRRAAAGESQEGLAREFGVGGPTMYKAVTGKTWQHVQVAPVQARRHQKRGSK
jgi:hypothetical protein